MIPTTHLLHSPLQPPLALLSEMCFYYNPFAGFDRALEDITYYPSADTVVERDQSTNDEHQMMFCPRYATRAVPRRHLDLTCFSRMDVREDKEKNAVTATFELPGLELEDVSIEVKQDCLTVAGKFHKAVSREREEYTIRE